jgi:hypothetical protein
VKLASESYEIKNEDKEIHAISVIMEVLMRHVITYDNGVPQCEEIIMQRNYAAVRCVNYVLDRLHKTARE